MMCKERYTEEHRDMNENPERIGMEDHRPGSERSTGMFCHIGKGPKGRPYYAHLSRDPRTTSCYGDGKIHEVMVTEDPRGDYWAWWDNKEQVFHNVYPIRSLVEMCFPYGTEIEEKYGKGHLLKVSVELK